MFLGPPGVLLPLLYQLDYRFVGAMPLLTVVGSEANEPSNRSEAVNLTRESLVPMSSFQTKLNESFWKLDFTIVTFKTKHKIRFHIVDVRSGFDSNYPIHT
jgi:hypothetical protein